MKTFLKRNIVTGGSGFIGSTFLNYVVPRYPDELFINVDSLTYAARPENIIVSNEENYAFSNTDIREYAALENIFEKYSPTAVIHFAAESHVDHSINDPRLFFETNVIGTHNLVQLAHRARVMRFHHISTDEVYGALNGTDPPFTETSPLLPRNPYSASKASAETILMSYGHTFGFPFVITRSSNNYGPRQDATKLIPKFIAHLHAGRTVPLFGAGAQMRDWLYVEDNARAIDLVFRNGVDGEIYNIGGGHEVANLEITRALLSLLERDESLIEYVADRPGHDFRYALSTKKIEDALNWRPITPFADGLAQTVAFYRTQYPSA